MLPPHPNIRLFNNIIDLQDPCLNPDHRHLYKELSIERDLGLHNGETTIKLWMGKDSTNMWARPIPFQVHLGSKLRFQEPREEKSPSAKKSTTFNRPKRIRVGSIFWGMPTLSKAWDNPSRERCRTIQFWCWNHQEITRKLMNRGWSAFKDRSTFKGSIKSKLRQRSWKAWVLTSTGETWDHRRWFLERPSLIAIMTFLQHWGHTG